MAKRIVVLGSYDTKGTELDYLARQIEARGCEPLRIDASLGGEATHATDVTSSEVAAAAGGDILVLRTSKDTNRVTDVMTRGASALMRALYERGELAGVVSVGGASNTGLATTVMKSLPFGVPKLMVSSMAAVPSYAGRYFGTKDVTMFHSVVDVAGLNPILENILARAAGAVCGMAQVDSRAVGLSERRTDSPRVAITEFKFSEGCCRRASELLAAAGVEVVPFHAQGIGDQAMEELIGEGLIDGVLDIVPSGVAEQLLGGNRAAGPHRLEAACRMGIPQVITPCGFDMLSCGPLERRDRGDHLWMSKGLAKRKLFIPDALRVQARTNAEELEQIADALAEKLNRSVGPTKLLIPTRGWSSLSEVGRPLNDFYADEAFSCRLQAKLDRSIGLSILDLALNTPRFAEVAVGELLSMMGIAHSLEVAVAQ